MLELCVLSTYTNDPATLSPSDTTLEYSWFNALLIMPMIL